MVIDKTAKVSVSWNSHWVEETHNKQAWWQRCGIATALEVS
jgi:hypothetical protein